MIECRWSFDAADDKSGRISPGITPHGVSQKNPVVWLHHRARHKRRFAASDASHLPAARLSETAIPGIKAGKENRPGEEFSHGRPPFVVLAGTIPRRTRKCHFRVKRSKKARYIRAFSYSTLNPIFFFDWGGGSNNSCKASNTTLNCWSYLASISAIFCFKSS